MGRDQSCKSGDKEEFKPRVFVTPVSCSGGRPTTCDPHTLGGAQCGEQRRPDIKHIKNKNKTWSSVVPCGLSDGSGQWCRNWSCTSSLRAGRCRVGWSRRRSMRSTSCACCIRVLVAVRTWRSWPGVSRRMNDAGRGVSNQHILGPKMRVWCLWSDSVRETQFLQMVLRPGSAEKGVGPPWCSRACALMLSRSGVARVVLRSDTEPVIIVLRKAAFGTTVWH